jgi:DNA-binding transcriptional regulator GbsR (MarR family)
MNNSKESRLVIDDHVRTFNLSNGDVARESINDISRATHMSKPRIAKALEFLERYGFVEVSE